MAAPQQGEDRYRRVVPDAGNLLAQQALPMCSVSTATVIWRGLGVIESSGVPDAGINGSMRNISARHRSGSAMTRVRCGEILNGQM